MRPLSNDDLGKALADLRQARGIDLTELSLQADVSRSSLRAWEAGLHVPSVPTLERLLDALDADLRTRARLLAATRSPKARTLLSHMPWGAPVDLGELLRSMRRRQGSTQADVARAVGVRQGTLAKWEAGDVLPVEETLGRTLRVLGATPEEITAVRTVRHGVREPLSDPFARVDEIAHARPIPLRDVLLLGVEAELWGRAMHDPAMDEALAHTIAVRAQQALIRGAEHEIASHVRRATRLARDAGAIDRLAPALYAINWVRQRGGRDATGAALSLGSWANRMRDPERRDWLTSSWALALVRSGETDLGIPTLKAFVDREEPGTAGRRYHGEDLVEAWLIAGEPGRAAEALERLGDDVTALARAKIAAARGESPATDLIASLVANDDWIRRGEAVRLERLAARVQRGHAPRLD